MGCQHTMKGKNQTQCHTQKQSLNTINMCFCKDKFCLANFFWLSVPDVIFMWHARSQLQRPSNDNINNIAQESGFLRQEIGEGAGSAVPSPHRMGVVRQRVAQASAPSCPASTSLARRDCPRFWRMDGGPMLQVLMRCRCTQPGTDVRRAAHAARMRTTYVLHSWQ